MKIIANAIGKFDIWFTKHFWYYFTNGRKVNSRKEFYDALSKKHKKESMNKLDSTDHFLC